MVLNRGAYDCGESRVLWGAGALGASVLLADGCSGVLPAGCSGVLRVRFLASLYTSAPCGSGLYFRIVLSLSEYGMP